MSKQAVHAIRLRGPWEFEPLERFGGGALPSGGRATMPGDWAATLGPEFRGRVRYLRRFGRPTGIAAGQTIHVVFEQIAGSAEVALNGQPLATVAAGSGPARCDVTDRLDPRNLLTVEIAQPADASEPGGLPGEVRLEIA